MHPSLGDGEEDVDQGPSLGDGEEDVDQGDHKKPAGVPATGFGFPVLLSRGSGTALRMDIKEPLCVKQEYTSQSIGQSTSPAWKGAKKVAVTRGG